MVGWKLANELSIFKGSANNIIDALGYFKSVCLLDSTKPHPCHKTVPKEVCSDMLSCYEASKNLSEESDLTKCCRDPMPTRQ
jgi:hypothetical protein